MSANMKTEGGGLCSRKDTIFSTDEKKECLHGGLARIQRANGCSGPGICSEAN